MLDLLNDCEYAEGAAEAFGRRGETAAAPEILELLEEKRGNLGDRSFVDALGYLGHKPATGLRLEMMKKQKRFTGPVEALGRIGAADAKPAIEAKFADENARPAMKRSAAWAMVKLGEKGIYLQYLSDLANQAAERNDRVMWQDPDIRAYPYSANLDLPEVNQTLEDHQNSSNPVVVDNAPAALIRKGIHSKAINKSCWNGGGVGWKPTRPQPGGS